MSRLISAQRVATLVGDFPRSPAYLGLADSLRVLIGDGRIGVGVRLPSERELTGALDVSRTTVTRAYEVLRESGYADARRGSGTFTVVPGGQRRQDRALMPGPGGDDVIDLNCAAHSAPPGLVEAYQRATDELPAYLSGPGYFPLGVPVLQARIAAAYDARGLPTLPEQVMVTAGALAAASIVAQAFTAPGERAVVESPTYPNATQAVRQAGARIVAADVDPDGWDLDALSATLRQTSPRLAYLIPDFQNPTGHLMSDAQREEVAGALARTRTTVVADEAHHALALAPGLADAMPRPLAAYAEGAITIGSASKSYWGGLRLGWVRAPLADMDRLVQARIGLDLGAPVLEQLVLADLMDRADEVLPVHRERLVAGRDALVAAVREHLPQWRFRVPDGGLALWCELPEPLGTATTVEAERRGVVVAPGPLFAVEGGLDRFVRIPWTTSPETLTEAVRRLAAAWDHVSTDAARTASGRAASQRGGTGRVMVA
ncbi:PLP-dependent aminotransferase family protein [Nocardioides hwasunensis]|uniref:PLP-dependent aminotransferase family protein n=1 Tax=Nocardioides hwasunensis TaxID=397258 RepID=A0ABR8MAJ3_9ACTN|nr:PLP-dependent aminotransferase family protein [Nocardioides hwasunensis]MBD3913175.1 PLP-dependent aminotransferase family protein [Nocardioides hwasunensis]